MVIPLNPGKFYGSSLPRPRYYTDIKFSDERVDPPVSVLDPLMSWAEEAHWSMGGLSFNRLRLQGKIEGNVKKLRKEREVTWNKKMENEKSATPVSESKTGVKKGGRSGDSPPPAPISKKRKGRKFVDEEEEFEGESSDEEEEIEIVKEMMMDKKKRRRLVRKLGDDFEMVGDENVANVKTPLKGLSDGSVAARTRSRRSMVLNDEDEEEEVVVKKEKNVVGNEKVKTVSETRKKNGKRDSASPASGTKRSSPRLKK